MDNDLRRGLQDLSDAAPVPGRPVPLEQVSTRVHRGRAVRATAAGLLGAAAVIGAVVVVNNAPWDPAPVPPASPTPSPTQEPTPSPTPTPDPTPQPTEEPEPTSEPTEPPIVALTTDGDLVLLDPETGATLEVITSDTSLLGPISITPDRSTAYMTRDGRPRQLVRVSLTDGSITTITDGSTPSVSPDGRTLAYVAPYNINHPDDPEWRSLALLDLATGDVQYLPDNTCGGCARRVDQPAWSPDSSRLYVSAGFEDGPSPTLAVLEVVPGVTSTLSDAPVFIPSALDREALGHPQFVPDGRMAFVGVTDLRPRDANGSGPPHDAIWGVVGLVDPMTSDIVEMHRFPELHSIAPGGFEHLTRTLDVAASPTAPTLAIVAQDSSDPTEARFELFLWEGGDQLRRLAEGIVAVGW